MTLTRVRLQAQYPNKVETGTKLTATWG